MKHWRTYFFLLAGLVAFTGCNKPADGTVSGGDTIKVGEFASLQGGRANFGQSAHQGTLLAIEEKNLATPQLMEASDRVGRAQADFSKAYWNRRSVATRTTP